MHHTHEQHRHKNSEWSVDELFDHFEAYLHTKNAEGVKEVLLILNRMACRRSNHQLMVPRNSPGAFLLKEMYFCVDLALMLFHRKQEEVSGSQFKYFVVDSSPQGGRNWLLSKCDSVDADSIPHATEAVSRLVNHAVTEASKQLAVSACPEFNQGVVFIRQSHSAADLRAFCYRIVACKHSSQGSSFFA